MHDAGMRRMHMLVGCSWFALSLPLVLGSDTISEGAWNGFVGTLAACLQVGPVAGPPEGIALLVKCDTFDVLHTDTVHFPGAAPSLAGLPDRLQGALWMSTKKYAMQISTAAGAEMLWLLINAKLCWLPWVGALTCSRCTARLHHAGVL